MHAAEAALRLGETAVAKEEIERASGLAPDDIVILSARAEISRENADYAAAAEAYETLASATSSKRRQVEALYQAAVLWLDRLNHRARGVLALQEAASVDLQHAGLLERLVALQEQSDDPDGLAELVERQRALAAEVGALDPGQGAAPAPADGAAPAGNDDEARQRRVAQHTAREEWAEAAAEQRELLERARDENERRSRLLHLVQLLGLVPTGASEAESLLEQARRTWPDDPSVLEAAGIREVNDVAAVTSNDSTNLVICYLAKTQFEVPRTIARVNNPKNEDLFRHLGVDEQVSPTRMILGTIEQDIPVHELLHLATLGEGDLELIEAHLQPGSPAIGRTARQLDLPEPCAVLAVVRSGAAVALGTDMPLREGDKVIAIGRSECEGALHRQLIGTDGSEGPI